MDNDNNNLDPNNNNNTNNNNNNNIISSNSSYSNAYAETCPAEITRLIDELVEKIASTKTIRIGISKFRSAKEYKPAEIRTFSSKKKAVEEIYSGLRTAGFRVKMKAKEADIAKHTRERLNHGLQQIAGHLQEFCAKEMEVYAKLPTATVEEVQHPDELSIVPKKSWMAEEELESLTLIDLWDLMQNPRFWPSVLKVEQDEDHLHDPDANLVTYDIGELREDIIWKLSNQLTDNGLICQHIPVEEEFENLADEVFLLHVNQLVRLLELKVEYDSKQQEDLSSGLSSSDEATAPSTPELQNRWLWKVKNS